MSEFCIYCFQDIEKDATLFEWIRNDQLLCGSCKQQLLYINMKLKIDTMPIRILYLYNEFLESMIYQYKEARDIALKQVFFYEHMRMIQKTYRRYTIVLMPSSQEKQKERGFSSMRCMLETCKLPIIEPFYKSENRKQSLQSYQNRLHIGDIIHLDETFVIPQTPLLLIDDVCTTGSTLKCAYRLLSSHTMKIEALVLCANHRFCYPTGDTQSEPQTTSKAGEQK